MFEAVGTRPYHTCTRTLCLAFKNVADPFIRKIRSVCKASDTRVPGALVIKITDKLSLLEETLPQLKCYQDRGDYCSQTVLA